MPGAQGPGNIEEYVEPLPEAVGNDPTDGSGDPGTDEPSSQVEGLDEGGAGGADLAETTGPDGGGDSAGSAPEGDSQSASDAGSGVPEVVGDVASGSDDSGMGLLLPLLIGAALVAALAFWIVRRRHQAGF